MNDKVIALVSATRTVEANLPNGWSFYIDYDKATVCIVGPLGACVSLKPSMKRNRAPEALLVGVWPCDSNGKSMDPYSWGVLKMTSPYPFKRINLKQHPEFLTRELLTFIQHYQPIFYKCLDKCKPLKAIAF